MTTKNPNEKTQQALEISYTPVATVVPPNDDAIQATPVADEQQWKRTAGYRTVSPEYNFPEAQGLYWEDDFFDDEPDIVAVFDLDKDLMQQYYSQVSWCTLGLTVLYTPLFFLCLAGLAPCYLRSNVAWNVNAQHVAVTRDGIRFVRDQRRTCWGWSCTNQGKSSKTVPFDKITDCDLEEPAGNTCCVIPNVLTTVNVDTASSGQGGQRELRIAGLKNAPRFKQLVWAMKRQYQASSGGGEAASIATNDVADLLRDIRDELRQNNSFLASLQQQQSRGGNAFIPMGGNGEEGETVVLS